MKVGGSKGFMKWVFSIRDSINMGSRNDAHREGPSSVPAVAEVLEYRVRLASQAEVTGVKKKCSQCLVINPACIERRKYVAHKDILLFIPKT